MAMTHKHAKDHRQGSFGSKVRVETDGQTDGRTDGGTEAIALPPMLTGSVITIIAYCAHFAIEFIPSISHILCFKWFS